jgi:hypothetical protein
MPEVDRRPLFEGAADFKLRQIDRIVIETLYEQF